MGSTPLPQSYENVFRTLSPSRRFEKRKGRKFRFLFHFFLRLCGIFTSPKTPKELCNVSSQTRTSPHHPPTGSDNFRKRIFHPHPNLPSGIRQLPLALDFVPNQNSLQKRNSSGSFLSHLFARPKHSRSILSNRKVLGTTQIFVTRRRDERFDWNFLFRIGSPQGHRLDRKSTGNLGMCGVLSQDSQGTAGDESTRTCRRWSSTDANRFQNLSSPPSNFFSCNDGETQPSKKGKNTLSP